MDRLEEIAERIRDNFALKYQAREKGLSLSREAIRSSANAIRAIHRNEQSEAKRLLAVAGNAVSEAKAALEDHPVILFAGFLQDAQKEYAEANLTYAFIMSRQIPSPDELGVGYAAYLNGLGEAGGELRRNLLDEVRKGNLERAEAVLQAMDTIYGILVTMDYPDAMTGGLRRTTDMVRGVLEKSRGDLTIAFRQRQLERALVALEQKMNVDQA